MTANQISYWKFNEDRRHNQAYERETALHNRNTEALTSQQIALGYAQLAETRRANVVSELLTDARNTETIRSNMAQERIKEAQLEESKRVSNANILLQYGKQKLDESRFGLEKLIADNKLTLDLYDRNPIVVWGNELVEGVTKTMPKLIGLFPIG